ncbi:MAG: DNA topoisomerase VI subunit B, partial [Bdellovibrionales bacterium]|nr:DNA topoisomerase VI subunit B [Bdellovibrionales bacterium]
MPNKITTSSTAEYFSKNLQQVGFSSPTKAVLTTLKEAVDNSLDACEEAGIAPSLKIRIEKKGRGSSHNTDLVSITVEDNGPGLDIKDLPKVFGEYLASSKFGRGRCSRGQQGIGISAATTWAQLTNAVGAQVISKTKDMKKAISLTVDMDIKNNKGLVKDKKTVDYKNPHGLTVKFLIDGRVQLNGEGGLITYLEGTALVNPHLSLEYQLLDHEKKTIPRVNAVVPVIPPSISPHPHTMKLGEFLQHAGLYGAITLRKFLRTGFSRMTNKSISDMTQAGLSPALLKKNLTRLTDKEYRDIFRIIQKVPLKNPSTQSVLIVGEEGLAESIHRLGEVDFFSVITRSPKICDYKSVVVEVALARFKNRVKDEDSSIQLLRFANRVPLQFDKASCAITKAVESVNWRAYGITQPKKSLPIGPYIFAIAVTSPFIKFKNASKETIDASEELVEEIRLALMRAGQKLKRHIRKEMSAEDLLRKKQHIEKFAPILIKKLKDITKASKTEVEQAEKGLREILSKDEAAAERALGEAQIQLQELKHGLKRGATTPLSESPEKEISDSSENAALEQKEDDALPEETPLSGKAKENTSLEKKKPEKKKAKTKNRKTELKHKHLNNKKSNKARTEKTKKS